MSAFKRGGWPLGEVMTMQIHNKGDSLTERRVANVRLLNVTMFESLRSHKFLEEHR